MAFALTVACTPAVLKMRPGGSSSVDVTISNVGDIIEHYDVTVEGLPPAYLTSAVPEGPKLKPRQSASVRLTIALPAKGGIAGGHYELGVLVKSKYTAGVQRAADLVLDVEAVSDLTLTPQPQVAQGRTGARFTVAVTNQGNTYVTVTLAAQDDQRKAGFAIQPPSMTVAPGQPGSIPFEVEARVRGALTGPERRTSITFSALVAGETWAEEPATLVQRPLIPPGVVRALGAAAAVLLIVGAIAAGSFLNRTPATPAAGGSPAPGTQTSAGPPAEDASKEPPTTGSSTSDEESTSPPSATDSPPPTSETGPPPSSPLQPLDETADDEVSVDPQSQATSVATCPEGTVVVGGGVEVEADSGSTPPTSMVASSPEDGEQPRRWRVSLLNQGEDAVDATVRATCAPEPPGYQVVEKEATVSGSGYAQADCPQGKVVLGGGGGVWTDETTADPGTTLLESRPLQVDGPWAAWRVAARTAESAPRSVVAYALCADPLPAYEVVLEAPSTVEDPTPGSDQAEAVAEAACPEAVRALSGGVGDEEPELDPSVDPGTTLVQSTLTGNTSDDAGSGWATTVRGPGAAKPALRVFAVCGNPEPS